MKLPAQANNKLAYLLYAKEIELGLQVNYFIEYDTTVIDGSRYELPAIGRYILLLFQTEGTIFTTLRRSTPEKLKYYLNEVGNTFMVEVKA